MLCHARFYIPLFVVVLLLTLCRVSSSKKPVISPSEKELVINEGDPLEIVCTGNASIKFTYPLTKKHEVHTSSVATTKSEEDGVYTFTLQRPVTIFGDTGWYSCANENVEITSDKHDDPEVNWVYVYVKSDKNLFVLEDTHFCLIDVFATEDVVIPCRPTAPDLVIRLDSDENEDELKNMTSFDPRIGFTIKNIRVIDSGNVSCVIDKNNYQQTIGCMVKVHYPVLQPVIHDEDLHHITRGQNLRINCTFEIPNYAINQLDILDFNWTRNPKKNNSRMSTQLFRQNISTNTYLVTSQLTILNVTDEDAGMYDCFIETPREYKKSWKEIVLHDSEIRYINLTPQHFEQHYQMKKGGYVTWIVYINGYPTPIVEWFGPKGKIVTSTTISEEAQEPKYSVKINPTSTVLKITSLEVPDTGVYAVEATNNYVNKRINFTLDVFDKPMTILGHVEPYYAPNQTAYFGCDAMALPRPNISLSFQQCPHYPLYINCTDIQLTSAMEAIDGSTINFISTAEMTIEASGVLTCEYCNELGCDRLTDIILVSDGVSAFGIIAPEEPITKGDTVELTCAASVYNYLDELTWKNEKDEVIKDTERIEIIHHKTQFTYQSTLRIYHVQESDAQNYSCYGRYTLVNDPTPMSDLQVYSLVVNEPVPQIFNMTNMYNTELYTEMDDIKAVILKYFVGRIGQTTSNLKQSACFDFSIFDLTINKLS